MIEKLPTNPITQAVTIGQPEIIAKLNEVIEAVNWIEQQQLPRQGSVIEVPNIATLAKEKLARDSHRQTFGSDL